MGGFCLANIFQQKNDIKRALIFLMFVETAKWYDFFPTTHKKRKEFIALSPQISQILHPLIPHQFKLPVAPNNGHDKTNH